MTQILPGFAVRGTFTTQGDNLLPPQATIYTVPSTSPHNTSITILWDTLNVGQISIAGNNHVDPPFSLGPVSTSGAGVYIWAAGFTHTITLTMTCYDAVGNPLGLTATCTVTIT